MKGKRDSYISLVRRLQLKAVGMKEKRRNDEKGKSERDANEGEERLVPISMAVWTLSPVRI